MLTELTISNFKGFGTKQRMRLAPITLIYGPNSSGKSSLIQALNLLSRSAESGLAPHGLASRAGVLDHGGYGSFVYGHDTTRRVTLGFRIAPSSKKIHEFHKSRQIRGGAVEAEFGLDNAQRHLDVTRLEAISYSMAERAPLLRFERHEEPPHWKGPVGIFRATQETSERLESLRRKEMLDQQRQRNPNAAVSVPDGVSPDTPSPDDVDVFDWLGFSTSGLDFPDVLWRDEARPGNHYSWDREALEQDGCDLRFANLAEECSAVLRRLRYLGPLRSLPTRLQPIARHSDTSVGAQGESTLSTLLQHSAVLLPNLNRWMDRFDCGYHMQLSQVGDQTTGLFAAINMKDRAGLMVTLADVGFGFSQILPILVEGLVSSDGIIAVEQPEIHLHPRLQAHLADFFVDTAIGWWLDASAERELLDDADVRMWFLLQDEYAQTPAHPDIPSHHAYMLELERDRNFNTKYGPDSTSMARRGFEKLAARRRGRNQWLIETHSEAIIVRLQRRIREGTLNHTDICVLYVDAGLGGCVVRELRLDEEGEFVDEWPSGFFEDTYRDLFGGRPR